MIMVEIQKEKTESRQERADRISLEYITAERRARQKKTARLREMRLNAERIAA
jgi:hypothetical protein